MNASHLVCHVHFIRMMLSLLLIVRDYTFNTKSALQERYGLLFAIILSYYISFSYDASLSIILYSCAHMTRILHFSMRHTTSTSP